METAKPRTLFLFPHVAMLVCIAHGGGPVRSDEWGPPASQHWSENGKYVLEVDDDKQTLTLQEKLGTGFALRWSIAFPQEHAPYNAYVTGDGRFVVLRDQHGEIGYGAVLVFLGANGAVLASYTLEELVTDSEKLDAARTESSIWWSSGGLFFFRAQQTQFAFVTGQGTTRCFDLGSGEMLSLGAKLKAQVNSDAVQHARELLHSDDPYDRSHGAGLVAALGDKQSIPALKELLDDPTVKPVHWAYEDMTGDHRTYPVQLAAGRALAALLGADAVALVDAKLSGANEYMTYYWIPVLADTGAARSSRELRKLTRSRNRNIRTSAIKALVKDDDGSVVRENVQWLSDRDSDIRLRALRAVAEHAEEADGDLLRAALDDGDPLVAMWAQRGLVRLDVPDLAALLRRNARRDDQVGDDAILHLARCGDAAALEQLVAALGRLRPQDGGENRGERQRWGIAELCKVLAERKPPGAEKALRAFARTVQSDGERRAFGELAPMGALAAFGDEHALELVRALAQDGHALDRADAIEWLGICQDLGSLDSLQAWCDDEEPWVREAARKALNAMPSDALRAWRENRVDTFPTGGPQSVRACPPVVLVVLAILALGTGALALLRRLGDRSR